MGLVPLLIGTIAVLALAMLGATLAMNWVADRMIGDKHRALEEIVRTARVPHSWEDPFDRRIARLKDEPSRAAKAARIRKRATACYLKKLDALTHYVGSSKLIEGEDTRQELQEAIGLVRAACLEADMARGPR